MPTGWLTSPLHFSGIYDQISVENERLSQSFESCVEVTLLGETFCIGLEEKDDPNAVSNLERFVDNMSCWPNIECSNIFIYFIERLGVYTQRQIVQYKCLDAYI